MEDSSLTLREAVEKHLADNGFPSDGGLSEKWAVIRLGPIPLCIPNIAARRRAIPYHDLNHVVSGYGNDDLGEAEIGAWELGSGCKDYFVAWILNWSALPLGLRSPRRLYAAFVRGRRSRNLYGAHLDEVLDRSLGDVRAELGVTLEFRGDATDLLLFVSLIILSPVVGLIPGLASVLTSPVWITKGAHRQRRTAPD